MQKVGSKYLLGPSPRFLLNESSSGLTLEAVLQSEGGG